MDNDLVRFEYEGDPIEFQSVASDDHLLGVMRRTGTFYERDVLERLRSLLGNRRTDEIAIDAGAYIGTHSVYFAKFCRLKRVLAFEANPRTLPFLVRNVRCNGLEGVIVPINSALGSRSGHAEIVDAVPGNRGASVVRFDKSANAVGVIVSTIDDEVEADRRSSQGVALIKIDVEGAELAVLAGARKTIAAHRPTICIEVHTARNLRKVLSALKQQKYRVVDCLGYSPTYVLVPMDVGHVRRLLINLVWLARASVPALWVRPGRLIKWYLRRLAEILDAR